MRQRVHLKTLSPLGQRDSAPHVMQFPEANSFSPSGLGWEGAEPNGCCAGAFDLEPGPRPSISASESESESKSSCAFLLDDLFLLGRRDGNGWLMERPWLGGRASRPGRCEWGAAVGAGAGAGAGAGVGRGMVGTKSNGNWEPSTRSGSVGREDGGSGFRGIILMVGRGALSREGRGCDCDCGKGGSGGSRCGGRGAPSMRSQLGDMVAGLSQGEYRESVIACRELTWL